MMTKRDCTNCIAYCNLLSGKDYRCGLGFEVIEEMESDHGKWKVTVHPYNNSCEAIKKLPTTKEEFVKTAARLGIAWDVEDVADPDDIY